MMKRTMLPTAVLVAGLMLGCGQAHPPARPDAPAIAVQTIPVTLQRTPDIQEVAGTVRPTNGGGSSQPPDIVW